MRSDRPESSRAAGPLLAKIGVMWAHHGGIDAHPVKAAVQADLEQGRITLDDAVEMTRERLAEKCIDSTGDFKAVPVKPTSKRESDRGRVAGANLTT
jgi:hypothetical protein